MSSRYYYKGFECYITYMPGVGLFYGESYCAQDIIVAQSKEQSNFKFCFEESVENYLAGRLEKTFVPSLAHKI